MNYAPRNSVAKTADGRVLSRADLPREVPLRWSHLRRDMLVELVLVDVTTAPELRDRYGITRDEFALWCRKYAERKDRHHD